MYLLLQGAECSMGNFFRVSYILQLISRAFRSKIIEKYEKPGKYLPILHEATCDNYFIVQYNKSKYSKSYLTNLLIASS